jgi:actin-related protein
MRLDLISHHLPRLKQLGKLNKSFVMSLLITKPRKQVYKFLTIAYDSQPKNSPFELPDGQVIQVGSQKFRCPEALFKPAAIGK